MKIVFLFLFSSTFSYSQNGKAPTNNTHQQDNGYTGVRLHDVSGKELYVLLNVNEENRFTEFYTFQYEYLDLSELTAKEGIIFRSYSPKDGKLILGLRSGETFELSVNPKNSKTKYIGYGLSKNYGFFELANTDYPNSIFELISFYEKDWAKKKS